MASNVIVGGGVPCGIGMQCRIRVCQGGWRELSGGDLYIF